MRNLLGLLGVGESVAMNVVGRGLPQAPGAL